MFTGIIEGLGTITAIRPAGKGRHLVIDSDFTLEGTTIGDSIAVNGACLTAVRVELKRFEVDLSPETVSKTTLGAARIGERVNLERALRLSDRIDGHLVSGHIDGVGAVIHRKTAANAILVTISVPENLTRYMIEKGSVAVDGISLTINRIDSGSFEVSIIPLTAQKTTIESKKTGDPVNIEADMIGKYVERFMAGDRGRAAASNEKKRSIDRQFLLKSGFI